MGYLQVGRAKDAEGALLKAISLAPNNPNPHLGLGTLYAAATGNSRGVMPPPGFAEITLEALGCSYEYARKMAEGHAKEVLRLSKDKELRRAANDQLINLKLMAQM